MIIRFYHLQPVKQSSEIKICDLNLVINNYRPEQMNSLVASRMNPCHRLKLAK